MNVATERRLDANTTLRNQLDSILDGFHPGDDVLDSIRSQNTPAQQLRVLGLMRAFHKQRAEAELRSSSITLH